MERYRVNPKNFPKFKRGQRSGEYYLEKPCLVCQPNDIAIHRPEKKTYYEVSLELQKKYKEYLPKLQDWEIEAGSTEEIRNNIDVLFWECRNCKAKSPMKYSNWDSSKGVTGNHYKLFEMIEDLDDVKFGMKLNKKWHLEAFAKQNFINIEESA
jgi:hypothetical protein